MIETAPKVIDEELALEQAGGSLELAKELFDMLLKELSQFERVLRAAFECRDWETLQRSAHKLTGAAIYCGVPALKLASETLETKLKRGHTEDVGAYVTHLLEEIHQVQAHAHSRLA